MQILSFTNSIPLSFFLALGIITGILSCNFLYEAPYFTILTTLSLYCLVCIGIIFSYQAPYITKPYIGIFLAIIAGFTRFYWQLKTFNSFDYSQFKKPVTIITHITGCSKSANSRLNQCFYCDITAIKYEHKICNFYAPNSVMIYSKGVDNIKIDDTIELRNVTLKSIENKKFATYLMKEGIVSTLFAENLEYTVLNRPAYSWFRWVHTYKTALFESIRKKCSAPTFTFFASLFLGDRTTNKKCLDQASEQFKYWGISHYLARSGLHMVIFVLVWQFLLKLLPINYFFKEILLFFLGIIYYLFSWSSISFIRAFLIFSFYKWCNITNKISHFLHILSLITGIVLIYNPLYLFFLDFQLSFLLTFALAWIATQRSAKEEVSH